MSLSLDPSVQQPLDTLDSRIQGRDLDIEFSPAVRLNADMILEPRRQAVKFVLDPIALCCSALEFRDHHEEFIHEWLRALIVIRYALVDILDALQEVANSHERRRDERYECDEGHDLGD